jgi:N-acetylneuraminic acid mutarotase
MIIAGDNIFIQSGLVSNFQKGTGTQVYQYNYLLQLFQKIPKPIFATMSAACTLVHYGKILYGILGLCDDKLTVQTFSLETRKWGDVLFTNCPNPMHGQAGSMIGDNVYIHGGLFTDFRFNPLVYRYNMEKLQVFVVNCEGFVPSKRAFHSMDTWNGKGVLFGGLGGDITHHNLYSFTGGDHYNDLWLFDPKLASWDMIELDPNALLPPKRRAHASTIMNDYLFINGGADGTILTMCDLWEFDLFLHRCKEYIDIGDFPVRRLHCMVNVENSIYIMGGVMTTKTGNVILLSDFYRFDAKEKVSRNWVGFEDVVFVLLDDKCDVE